MAGQWCRRRHDEAGQVGTQPKDDSSQHDHVTIMPQVGDGPATGALEGSGPRRALLTLLLDGRRFALQVGVEPRDAATKCVGTVLNLEKSMTFGRIEDGF